MKRVQFWSRKLYRRAVQELGSRFYINPDPDLRKSILVAGTARSGTTWLGDLLAAQLPSRILFEPFNPELVPEYRGFNYFQYMPPGGAHPEFGAFARKVFTGEIRNRWVDRQNERIRAEYRLIKEIRINLALKWLHDQFPEVPLLFLIRHPCAVVLSRMELGWATDRDIAPFLSQPALVHDYLRPYLDLIQTATKAEEQHAMIWCISNLVPLKQFMPGELKIVYYENLCTQPEIELPRLFTAIGQERANLPLAQVHKPSQTTRTTSAVVSGMDKIAHWKKKLTPTQIDNILHVVEAFGLQHLYGEALLPLDHDDP